MKVCEEILSYLIKNDIKTIYGIPSGTISPIVDAFNDFSEIEYIITKNEAASSYSASKYAQVTQKIGVCLISGSVGIGNAMNGIAEAFDSKAPMLILSGYVARYQQGLGAIQELTSDIYLNRIVKYTVSIDDEKNVVKELKKAMEIGMEHPRGPVHIGIPLDIQRLECTGSQIDIIQPRIIQSDYASLNKAAALINESNNGLVMIGGGCRNLREKIIKLVEKLNWRFVTTASGKGIIEENHRLHMGNFGFPGTDFANTFVKEQSVDCVLVLGSRLGESATGNFNKNLIKNKLIHIDIDNTVFNKAYLADISVVADLNEGIDYLTEKINYKSLNNDIKEPLNHPYIKNHTGLSLRVFYEKVTAILPKNTFYVTDMGSSMMYCFKYLKLPKQADFESNLNYACMGSSIGAMGISRIDPNRLVAVFIGDGSFYMNGMTELLTAKKYNMNIVYFIINNSSLNLVDQGHMAIFGRTIKEFSDEELNIAKLVDCMDIPSIRIKENDDIESLNEFLSVINGPIVIEVVTDSTEPIPTNRFEDLARDS